VNWLIIAPSAEDVNLKKIKNFLRVRHNVTAYEIDLFANLTSEELYEDLRHVVQTTHCIILDSAKLSVLKDYSFILGVLSGKDIQTFIYTGGKYDKRYETLSVDRSSCFHVYDSLEEMAKYVDLMFDTFVTKDNQKQALIQLFALGIPFTSDCFANYIAKADMEVCQLFYDAGMMMNARTSDGVPLLCIATRSDSVEMVQWLLANGADIDAISGDRGYSAVMDAVWRKNYDITELLIECGANLSFISSDGQPILVLAVGNGNARICKLLLDNGANPDICDSMGMSARSYATLFKRQDIVQLMNKSTKH